MRSVAFFNNKGGVGKTTLLCNIASFLAVRKKTKVLVVDADPQCNTTQLLLDEKSVDALYEDPKSFTIHSVIHPLSIGKGYSDRLVPRHVQNFAVDLVPGDPRLALKEDLLSQDWQSATSGDIRGLRTSFVFAELLARCSEYDFVFFDMGPSLGSINRAVLLACDYFISPMSIDIFSLRAIENISIALTEWRRKLRNGVEQIKSDDADDLPHDASFNVQFLGYVAQQYNQRTKHGVLRAVDSYDKILKRIPGEVRKHLIDKANYDHVDDYKIGEIPNLYSLIPMAQTAHKPIFELRAGDGVRGAHFNKVKEAGEIFQEVSTRMLSNIQKLK